MMISDVKGIDQSLPLMDINKAKPKELLVGNTPQDTAKRVRACFEKLAAEKPEKRFVSEK